MKIERYEVFGFEAAFFGMRNAKNSWNKSDSCRLGFDEHGERFLIGPNDLKLAKSLIKGGSEHRKFLRAIHIQVDIIAPRYWLTELDTYKVSTVRLSCSTMHKLTDRKEFTKDDFEQFISDDIINYLNDCLYNYHADYIGKEEKQKLFRYMKNILPEGFLQRITYDMNYETAITMLRQRRNHRLPEWSEVFCPWILSLPNMKGLLDEK